jgi:hypothetical protein
VLAEMAVEDPQGFATLVEVAREHAHVLAGAESVQEPA